MHSAAAEQLDRIVSLVAELTRRAERGMPGITVGELAERFGTTPSQIRADIRTLTHFGDHVETDWLLSLSVWQEGEFVSITSGGAYRRPIRLTPEELCAIQVALEAEEGGTELAAKICSAMQRAATGGMAAVLNSTMVPLADVVQDAVANAQRLSISYAGERGVDTEPRVIQPHQVFEYNGRTYVVAWCERSQGWRHFRLDRVLHAEAPPAEPFELREDFEPVTDPSDALRGHGDGHDDAHVRFASDVARWIRERYADHDVREDGSVTVRFKVANTQWLVGRVLQYGDAAEVLEPQAYRDAVAAACASPSARR